MGGGEARGSALLFTKNPNLRKNFFFFFFFLGGGGGEGGRRGGGVRG